MPQVRHKFGLRARYLRKVLDERFAPAEHPCPICGFGLSKPAEDFTICPCCGVEFGYGDAGTSHRELRAEWIGNGAKWSSTTVPEPKNWNPWVQLVKAGFAYELANKFGIQEISNSPTVKEIANMVSGHEGVEAQKLQYN
jgi:hypothetical protein